MANNARSTRKVKNDVSDSFRGKQNSKQEPCSGAEIVDASGLRRSPRGTPLKGNMTPSPSSTRKSKRLENQTPTNFPIKRKYEGVENKSISSSLRRSERGRNHTLAISSGSKKVGKSSASSDVKQMNGKKEMTIEELTLQTVEVVKNGNKSMKNAQVVKKRMDARTYRDLFKQLPKKINASDHAQFTSNNDKSTEGCNNNCRGGVCEKVDGDDECSQSGGEEFGHDHASGAFEESNYVRERTETDVERSDSNQHHVSDEEAHTVRDGLKDSEIDCVLISSVHTATQRSDGAGKAELDYSTQKNLQPQSLDSVMNWVTGDLDIGLEGDNESISFKRKRNSVDSDPDTVASVGLEDPRTEIANAPSSSPSGCKSHKICVLCSKRRRVDRDLDEGEICSCKVESFPWMCNPSLSKDRGESEAGVTTAHVEGRDNHIERESSVESRLDFGQQTCIVCKLGGTLLCCAGRGCKRRYHLSCVSPPLVDVPLGIWLCLDCVKKKIELGVYSVTEGIESIWDVREEELPDDYGLGRQKQFFVKYKGLAHVHNRWVPENQLILEAPLLVEEFNKKDQVAKWKQVWTVPRRLLQKRLLPMPKQHEEDCSGQVDRLDCEYEWLVKWCGLDYEHSTWELENTSFMKSREAARLVRDFQSHHEKERRAVASSNLDKVFKTKREKYIKLSQPSGSGPNIDNNHMDFVNNLSEYWHKGQNALVVDEQEHITKVIQFILSLSSFVCQPFLIISTSDILYSWDNEFMRLASSLHVVVYHGDNDVRKSIRTLEFYEEGCIMFQVLITSPEVIVEDLSLFECIKWEAIVVDECQLPGIFSHFVCFKMLCSDTILLLVSGQLKNDIAEHLLCLLECSKESNASDTLTTGSHDNDSNLKERLSNYIVDRCKSDSSRFVEFWVPVELSNLQLEQYCSTLLSNSLSLCSSSKGDPVGALRNILHSIRKCCDHPYLTDSMLPKLLNKEVKEVEFLDVGIKASGKLQLLEAMLFEIKKRGLRVLILFQSCGGSGKDNIGDYLDDFLRQRFGPDTYERIDLVVATHKKQAALNKFNNDKGRFVFLLETRACTSGIKLSSVDSVIIFGSDWNPVNDVRLLQRVTLDSQYNHLKLFRLYSSYTVEEKALILAKQDKSVDSNLQNTNRNTSDLLLMWGSSYLFNRLDEFHQGNSQASGANISLEKSLLKDVIREFLTVLAQNGEESDTSDCSLILKVKQNQGYYKTSYPLFGEPKIQLTYEEHPHIFWKKLLDGKKPRWIYSSGPSKRNRKQVQHFENLLKPGVAVDNVVKKRKKVVNNNIESLSPGPPLINGEIGSRSKKDSVGNLEHDASQSLPGVFGSKDNTIYASTSLPLTNKLSGKEESYWIGSKEGTKVHKSQKSLALSMKPEIVKLCRVLQLPEDVKGMVEKFLEYLMNNHHINREPVTIMQAFQISLCWTAASLLKQRIDHKESLALAKQHLNFSCRKEEADYIYSMLRCLKTTFLYHTEKCMLTCCKESELSGKDVSQKNSSSNVTLSATSKLQEGEVEVWGLPRGEECSSKQVVNRLSSEPEFKLAQKDISRSIKIIQKKCEKQMSKLLEKQQEEKQDLDRKYREEIAKLQNKKRTELAVIRSYASNSILADKLKLLDNEYAKKFEELKCQMDIRLKDLEAMQLTAKKKLGERGVRWVEALNSWAQDELLNVRPSDKGCPKQGNIVNPCSEEHSPGVVWLNMPDREILSEVHETVSVSDCQVEVLPVNLCTSEIQTGGPISSLAKKVFPIEVPMFVNCEAGKRDAIFENEHLCEGLSAKEVEGSVTLCSLGGPGSTVFVSRLPLEGQTPDVPTSSLPDAQVQLQVPGIASSSNDIGGVVSGNQCSSSEQISNGASFYASDGNSPSGMPEISVADVTMGGDTSRENGVNCGASDSLQVNQPDGVGCNINKIFHFSDNIIGSDIQDREVTPTVPETAPSLSIEGLSTTARNEDHVTSSDNNISRVNQQNGVVFTRRDDSGNPVASQYTTGFNLPDEVVCIVNQMPHSSNNISGSDQHGGEVAAGVPETVPSLLIEGFNTRTNNDDSVASDGVERQNENVSSSKENDRADHVASDYATGFDRAAGMGCINNQMLNSLENTTGFNLPDEVVCIVNQMPHSLNNITASDQHGEEIAARLPETVPSQLIKGFSTRTSNVDSVASDRIEQQNEIVSTSNENDRANHVASDYATGVDRPDGLGCINNQMLNSLDNTTGFNLPEEVVCIVSQMPNSLDNITGSDQHGEEVAARVTETVPSQLIEGFSTRTSNDDTVASDTVEQQNENVSTSKESDRANHLASDCAPGVDRPDGLGCISNQMLNSSEYIPGSYSQGEKGTDTVHGTAASQLIEDVNTRMRNDDFVPSNNNTAGVNQDNGVVFTTIQDSDSQDLSSINPHVVQAVTTWIQSSTTPLNQEVHDECSPPAIIPRLASGDATVSGEDTTLQQVENPLADSFYCHAGVTEPLVQQQLTPSVGCPSNFSVQYLPSTREMSHPCSERHIINQISQPLALLENRVEISNQSALQSATCLAPHLPIDAPVGGLGMPVSDTRNASITSRNSNHPVQNGASFMPHMPLSYHDPLQSEMERIQRERDHSIINHEGTKLQLKSDCEKEIGEAVAQIRKKYEIKLQEVDSEFLTNKKDMDENLNKVLMNKILAAAFRSKCMDTKVSTSRGLSQAGLPCGFPPTTAVRAPGQPTTTIAPGSPQTPTTFRQAVHQSTALLSGTSTRMPQSISNPTPTSNLQYGSQIRACAPHLRPFRPSSSPSVTGSLSLPLGMPSQQELSYPSAASSLLTQEPTIRRPPPPTYQSSPYNRVHQPEIIGGLPPLPNSSLSALALLMDIENQTIVNPRPPSYAPPAPEFSNFDPSLVPEYGPIRGTQANTPHSSGPPDLVCLSDDD